MIALVVITLLLYRGGADQHRRLPVRGQPVGVRVLDAWPRRCTRSGETPTRSSRPSSCSRNVARDPRLPGHRRRTPSTCTSRSPRSTWRPSGCRTGSARCCRSPTPSGKPRSTSPTPENLDEDQVFGRGKVEDFTWKGMLDFATCTECGRCQSQCPAWNTGKPLSPEARDHGPARPPVRQGALPARRPEAAHGDGGVAATGVDEGGPESAEPGAGHGGVPESGFGRVPQPGRGRRPSRPLVGTAEEGGVIDPDVLWSCTTCGACVEQCPVDIEHVDHIVDMRRYQVLVESAFPSEAGVMLRNIENKGNPWGLTDAAREEWTAGPRLRGAPGRAGRADPGRRRVPVLGRLRRRAGGPVEEGHPRVRRAAARRRASSSRSSAPARPAPATRPAGSATSSCSRCRPCRTSRRSTRSAPRRSSRPARTASTRSRTSTRRSAATTRSCTTPSCSAGWSTRAGSPRSSRSTSSSPTTTPATSAGTTRSTRRRARCSSTVPGLRQQEMHRCKERGFCCGAGGARMWMEEKIGKRINVERVDEALALDPDVVSTACPYCMVMLSDAVTAKKQSGEAREDVEVLDVAQILRRSLAVPGSGCGLTAAAYGRDGRLTTWHCCRRTAPGGVIAARKRPPASSVPASPATSATSTGRPGRTRRRAAKRSRITIVVAPSSSRSRCSARCRWCCTTATAS